MSTQKIKETQEVEIGEPPYIYSPYPEDIVQVAEPGTRGQRDVVKLIHEQWPSDINGLEEASEEMFEDGYSGTFIRNVLRNLFAPADLLESQEKPIKTPDGEGIDEETLKEEIPEKDFEEDDENGIWHTVFRMGIRVALESEIDEEEAFEAFGSGFVEGQKLKEEMNY